MESENGRLSMKVNVFRRTGNGYTDKAVAAYGDRVAICLAVSSDFSLSGVRFYLGNDEKVLIDREVELSYAEAGTSFYETIVDTLDFCRDKSGLFFYHFEAEGNNGRLFSSCTGGVCTLEDAFAGEFRLTVTNRQFSAPSFLDGGVIYHIFVDRFAKSREHGVVVNPESAFEPDWYTGIPEFPENAGDSFPNNKHFGGSLYGVTENLDYLAELGITCIYLSPVFRAFSNHKYDTGDFLQVDNCFGGEDALRELIQKAGEKDIFILLDGVFNHVGDDSRYFNKYGRYSSLGAYQSEASEYADWFVFGKSRDEYDAWWGLKNLPKIRAGSGFEAFITDSVIPKYMNMGVCGFRLDVVDELSNKFISKIAKSIKKIKKDAYILGEVWEDASCKIAYSERKKYFQGSQLDGVMNYPFRTAVLDFLLSGTAELIKFTLSEIYENYPTQELSHIMNIAGTHDTPRALSVLSGVNPENMSNTELSVYRLAPDKRDIGAERLKKAYLLLAFLPGVPCIYYGDEAGTEGWHDPFNRTAFKWNNIDHSIRDWFVLVNKIRRKEPLFYSDDLKIHKTEAQILMVSRSDGEGEIALVCNLSGGDFVSQCGISEKNTFCLYRKENSGWKKILQT